MELTDRQWIRLEPIILQSICKKDTRDPREALNGILWALRTGAQWKNLPDRYRTKTCCRRFQQWTKAGVFRRIIEELAAGLQERGCIDIREAFIDDSFVPAKKGRCGRSGKGSRIMAITDAACLASASTYEVETRGNNVGQPFYLPKNLKKLIGEKAYDSDKLDNDLLKKQGVEMIAPQPHEAKNSGWPKAEAISTPLESRAAFQLAAKF